LNDYLVRPGIQSIGLGIAVGIGYFLTTRLGLALRTEMGAAAFWPAGGIAVGALIVFGRNVRLAIAAAIAIATIACSLIIGASPWPAIALGVINAGQALLTVYLIECRFDHPFAFDDVRHILGFVVAAVLGAAVCSVGAAAVTPLSTTAPFWEVWRGRFMSNAVGIVVVAPLFIVLAQLWRERPSEGNWIEGGAALALLGLATTYTVTSPHEFIRRFLIHVLPKGFHRIRHYGLLAGGARDERLAQARQLLDAAAGTATDPEQEAATDAGTASALATPCPCCGGRMIVVEILHAGCQPSHAPAIRIDTS
jgi:hypothetical protein